MLMFSLKSMTLRKKTIDNSVKFVPQIEKTKERNIKPNAVKTHSLPRKQNNNISQNIENFLKNVAAGGFGFLK